jgi:hypothetical protein
LNIPLAGHKNKKKTEDGENKTFYDEKTIDFYIILVDAIYQHKYKPKKNSSVYFRLNRG